MFKHCTVIGLLLVLPLAGIAQKLRVAVAANAQFVAGVLAKTFEQQTGTPVELIVGASGKLTTQIAQGAPFDVFLSADMKYPQALFAKKLTVARPRIYTYGTLVLWSKAPLKAGLISLRNQNLKKIAIANPALAPYGEAATQALQKLKLFDELRPKLVFGESIAQVNQYLLSGAADAVFTAKSVVLDPSQRNTGTWTEVDSKLYKPIAQGVVVLKSAKGKNLNQAQAFCQFLFSNTARQIFKQYGYR